MVASLKMERASAHTRRKFPRIGLRCEFCVADAVNGEFTVPTVDLSFGGAFFETNNELPLGDVIRIALKKDGGVTETQARVVHRHKTGYGISFIDPPDDFYNSLTDVLFDHVVSNVRLGAPEDTVPARIALLRDCPKGYQVLFSTHLNPKEVWVLTEQPLAINETFWVTLCEHGMFDCQVQVVWCSSSAMGLAFVNPSDEFCVAYDRVFNSFLGC